MLTPEQRQSFAADGFLVVRGVLNAARVAELEQALDALVPEERYANGFSGRVVEIAGASQGAAALAENARDPRLTRLASEALGVRRLRLLQDTAFIKPAGGGGRVEWHQDFSYFAFFERPAALTIRVALTACTADNGCLRVLGGSHAWGLQGADLSFRATSVDDALLAVPQHLREQARRETLIELLPGDVSLHHCLAFHSSAPNPTARPRKTLAMRFIDADLRVVAARLPSPEAVAYLATDADGRPTDATFPLVYDAGAS